MTVGCLDSALSFTILAYQTLETHFWVHLRVASVFIRVLVWFPTAIFFRESVFVNATLNARNERPVKSPL